MAILSVRASASLPTLGHQRRRDSGLWRFRFGELRGMRLDLTPRLLVGGMLTITASPSRDTAPFASLARASEWDAYENRIPIHYSKGHPFWVGPNEGNAS